MAEFKVNRNPSDAELRQFGVVMLGGLTVIGVLLWVLKWFLLDPPRPAPWVWTGTAIQYVTLAFWAIGLAIFLLSRLSLPATRVVYVSWMSLAMPLGFFMTGVLLTVVFVIVLPVFSLIRLKDPLRLKLRAGGSYWEDAREHEPTLERMQRPF